MTGWSQAHIDRIAYDQKWGERGDNDTYSPERDGPREQKREWCVDTLKGSRSDHLTELQADGAKRWHGMEQAVSHRAGGHAKRCLAMIVRQDTLADIGHAFGFYRMEYGKVRIRSAHTSALVHRTLDALAAYLDDCRDTLRAR